jgi:hypothetical protein
MTTIEKVPVEAIDHNPFRHIGHYPFVMRKLDALKRSIDAVGLWEGIIARKNGNRYELAFGHHRYEAARQYGMLTIPVIIRDLNDEQMLAFMGRENMEDFNADFLAMLETWEAAWEWKSRDFNHPQPIEVARLLGWNTSRGADNPHDQMGRTAGACNAARNLIAAGHILRADLIDLNVNQAREICERAQANIERIEKAGKALKTPAPQIAAAKEAVAKAVKSTAKQSRAGEVSQKDLRSQVDVNAYKHAQASKVKNTPLFAIFGKALADGIGKMLLTDNTSARLEEVIKALPDITHEDDLGIVRRLQFELGELSERATKLQKKMVPTDKKVTPLAIV